MTPAFHTQYRPLTSRPFLRGESYSEFAPCGQLAPYVACFWTSAIRSKSMEVQKVLVIPDTCVDIIIEINHTRQTIKSRITGLADSSMLIEQRPAGETVTTFAVRFYFWAVRLFFDVEMKALYNQVFDYGLVDPEGLKEFEVFFTVTGTQERIAWMESRLMKKLENRLMREWYSPDFYNSIARILYSGGGISVKEICEYTCVSQRQMERFFLQNIGISMKRTSCLVRYQNVWRDVVRQTHFDILEAVYRYGYADQAHLLNEFKRFHSVTPEQAKQIAFDNR